MKHRKIYLLIFFYVEIMKIHLLHLIKHSYEVSQNAKLYLNTEPHTTGTSKRWCNMTLNYVEAVNNSTPPSCPNYFHMFSMEV